VREMMGQGADRRRGFTLLELLIVLLIVGMVAGLMAPAFSGGLVNMRLKAAAQRLAASLRYARSLAVAHKETVQVELDLDGNSYCTMAAGRGLKREERSEDGEEQRKRGTFGREVRLPEGVSFKLVSVGDEALQEGRAEISFYPKGNSSGGEVVLGNVRERYYKIRVESITGRVQVERLASEEVYW